jgi:DNA modification methylase
MASWQILHGDVRDKLSELADGSVQCVVTSPPYWGLRNYGCEGQIGLEATPEAFVGALVSVFADIRRVLANDGVCWLNLGDSYSGSGKGGNPDEGKQATNRGSQSIGVLYGKTGDTACEAALTNVSRIWTAAAGIKAKQLIGIPWRVAFALQADGWYLRSDIIWSKPNPMPESVTDRPTKAHEYIFLLSKSARYYYDADAIAERLQTDPRENYPARAHIIGRGGLESLEQSAGPQQRSSGGFPPKPRASGVQHKQNAVGNNQGGYLGSNDPFETRNKRSVWTVATQPYPDAHFATFPEALIEPCILAGSRPEDTVLDPFNGSGTTGVVAIRHQRNYIGIELNADYIALARKRIGAVAPLFSKEASA